jgi:hypothetical protein
VQQAKLSSVASVYGNLSDHGHYKIPYVDESVSKTFLKTSKFDYYVSDQKQWQSGLHLFRTDSIGNIEQGNSINAAAVGRKPTTINNQFVQVDFPFEIDQFFSMYTKFIYNNDFMELDFHVIS